MFAVIKTGGKQYHVKKDDIIAVEKLETQVGETHIFEDVLLYNDGTKTEVGAPIIAKIGVAAEVLEQTKGDKVIIFKKKRRQNYRRKNGHRQLLTYLKVTSIGDVAGLSKAKPAKKAEVKETKTEEAAVVEVAEKPKPKAKAAAPKASATKSTKPKAAPKAKAAKSKEN